MTHTVTLVSDVARYAVRHVGLRHQAVRLAGCRTTWRGPMRWSRRRAYEDLMRFVSHERQDD
jgi:hypothetical protein